MDATLTAEPLTIDDPEIAGMLRDFARDRSVDPIKAVGLAVREARAASAAERARMEAAVCEIQEEFARLPKTGLTADKAFYDSLNDEED